MGWIYNMATMFRTSQLCGRLNEVIATVSDEELRNRFIKIRDEYQERIRKLNKPDLTSEDSKQIQQEHYRIENLVHKIKIMGKGIPAKHILYCRSPGHDFREEIDISRVNGSYEDDFLAYRKKLNIYIDEALGKQDVEKYLHIHHNGERPVDPESSFIYSDAVQKMIKKRLCDHRIDFYLDTVTQDGTVIETEKIDITDFLKRNPEYFQKEYIIDATNEYISASLKRFVQESFWQFSFHSENRDIYDLDDPDNWPSLKDNGKWIAGETTFYPQLWFGLKDKRPVYFWNLGYFDVSFWFDEDNEKYLVSRYSNWDVGRYCGFLPDMKPIRDRCPIMLESSDTPRSIKQKTQDVFIEKYRKIH